MQLPTQQWYQDRGPGSVRQALSELLTIGCRLAFPFMSCMVVILSTGGPVMTAVPMQVIMRVIILRRMHHVGANVVVQAGQHLQCTAALHHLSNKRR